MSIESLKTILSHQLWCRFCSFFFFQVGTPLYKNVMGSVYEIIGMFPLTDRLYTGCDRIQTSLHAVYNRRECMWRSRQRVNKKPSPSFSFRLNKLHLHADVLTVVNEIVSWNDWGREMSQFQDYFKQAQFISFKGVIAQAVKNQIGFCTAWPLIKSHREMFQVEPKE